MPSIEERKSQLQKRKDLLERTKSTIRQSAVTTATLLSMALPGKAYATEDATNSQNDSHAFGVENVAIKSGYNETVSTADFATEQAKMYQDEQAQKLIRQKNISIEVDYNNEDFRMKYYDSYVGNLNLETCRYVEFKSMRSPIKKEKRPEIVTIDKSHPMFNENYLAYFFPTSPNTIFLQKMDPLSEDLAKEFKDTGLNYIVEYRKGNPVAKNLAAYHEWGHQQAINNANPEENLQYFSDLYRNDRLNEKRSKAIEYLYIANQYSQLKERGIETIEYGGEKHPVESILEICPELKDYLTQNNFDINNKEQVRDIVKISSDTWNSKHAETYKAQHFNFAKICLHADNLFQTIGHDDKAYDKVANNMLKNVLVDFNTNIDLRYCKDLLDDYSHEDVLTEVKDKNPRYSSLTFGEVIQIDNYFNSIGLSSDSDKAQYLEENFKNIVTRQGPVDEGLKDMLLSPENASIKYADGMEETKDGKLSMNGVTIDLNQYAVQETPNNQQGAVLQAFLNANTGR